jgi:hypothetical protein
MHIQNQGEVDSAFPLDMSIIRNLHTSIMAA